VTQLYKEALGTTEILKQRLEDEKKLLHLQEERLKEFENEINDVKQKLEKEQERRKEMGDLLNVEQEKLKNLSDVNEREMIARGEVDRLNEQLKKVLSENVKNADEKEVLYVLFDIRSCIFQVVVKELEAQKQLAARLLEENDSLEARFVKREGISSCFSSQTLFHRSFL
jgi:hypothetical protein